MGGSRILGVCLLVVVAVVGLLAFSEYKARQQAPRRSVIVPLPVRPLRPEPPRCPRCPREGGPAQALTSPLGASVGGRVSSDGTPLSVDYPGQRHMENKEGNDGLGLCVYAANSMAMDWGGIGDGRDLLEFMTHRPGGGTPTKFADDMNAFWKAKGKPAPPYLQYVGPDLDVMVKAVSSGRMVCGTYYRSPTGRYGGQRIAHMVDWVHADGERFAVLDNNKTGERSYEWMSRSEAERCCKDGSGKVWLVIYTAAPPPPPPHNLKESIR